ncbi:AraC family transcriptional regulator [Labrenzia sp. PHM005]|uniref:helix-turn-helix domain-containing protein n=1 Tax=Labrenzia sp. PHM005 TaxID=2590016 RepID=UPI00143D8A37|nr:AraC family transcriptional regulator [Labrenzia sp. PHM005]
MDNTRTMRVFDRSEVFFHATDPLASPWPYTVPVGGQTIVTHQDGMVRRSYHEHVLILTLSGAGRVEVGGQVFKAGPDSLVWLDTSQKYGHGADRGAPWTYLWFAMAGPGLDRLHEQLALLDNPVIEDLGNLCDCFEAVIAALRAQLPDCDAHLNAQVAAAVAALFRKRAATWAAVGNDPINEVMRQLRRRIDGHWEIEAMANIAGLSPSQLFRRFKAATGTTPIFWLRQERMMLAEHLLTATTSQIVGVAARCGYSDPYHFSRDFKRHSGVSPRRFRQISRNEPTGSS